MYKFILAVSILASGLQAYGSEGKGIPNSSRGEVGNACPYKSGQCLLTDSSAECALKMVRNIGTGGVSVRAVK